MPAAQQEGIARKRNACGIGNSTREGGRHHQAAGEDDVLQPSKQPAPWTNLGGSGGGAREHSKTRPVQSEIHAPASDIDLTVREPGPWAPRRPQRRQTVVRIW